MWNNKAFHSLGEKNVLVYPEEKCNKQFTLKYWVKYDIKYNDNIAKSLHISYKSLTDLFHFDSRYNLTL